jgi:hypothetical protein
MQSEEFDKKIKEAAENHHPAYDEKAWMNMEKLLDKHLPQEKEKKRRFIFILFFLLLLGGAGYILLGLGKGKQTGKELAFSPAGSGKTGTGERQKESKPDDGRNNDARNTTAVKKSDSAGKVIGEEKQKTEIGSIKEPGYSNGEKKIAIVTGNDAITKAGSKHVPGLPDANGLKINGKKKGEANRVVTVNKTANPKIDSKTNTPTGAEITAGKDKTVVKKDDAIFKAIQPGHTIDPVGKDENLSQVDNKKPSSEGKNVFVKKEDVAAKNDTVTAVPAEQMQKIRSGNKGSFFIAASVAPDLSIVGVNKPGTITLAAGAGVGYSKGRITIRSGFYSARKIYDAYPNDYHAPAAFYNRYPDLQEIKADCKVYEIPILLSYNFKKGGRSNWFATTGLSSYLMKSETYDYYYKQVTTGPVVNRKRTITNANQYYFTVVTIGAGYQYSFGKRFTILAEPYFKLPATGIGFGKVKLNSAGIQFSLAFKPFLPKIKK